jgi:hypothetical protein
MGGDRELNKRVYMRRETSKVPKDIDFPVIKGPNDVVMFEDDLMGKK